MEGISEPFYNYLYILRSQGGNNGGGPFQSQPATVKGNVVNQTNPENYPLDTLDFQKSILLHILCSKKSR